MTDLRRLHALFDELVEVPAERWDLWFDQRGLDTETRLALHRLAESDRGADGPLDRSLGNYAREIESLEAHLEERVPDPIGRRVGPFRILARLGQGGMATVFLAARTGADFDQQVALKLLRRPVFDELDLALFRRERQVLARLHHPHIARLVDGGMADDGTPYLAMEHVDGVPITRWCAERSLDRHARVALVAKVARAAAAAHAMLVVHRDIKPSNVLVDRSGEPRLLDFGIAKLIDPGAAETTRSAAPMTPEYAAPEQFTGEPITTATDVYALGVLLHELLTGRRPERRASRAPSAAAAPARTREAAATRAERLTGDLDKVVRMALAEEPSRRYAGAAALADDLERWLAHEPVAAHPPSLAYRTRKFVQRHRGGVIVTLLLLLGVFAGVAAAVRQTVVARQEAARANAVRDFLVGALDAGRADRPREQRATIAELVAAARTRIDGDAALDAGTRAEILHALGDVAYGAGEYDEAIALHRRALAAREALSGTADARSLALRARLAELLNDTGDTAAARALLDAAPDVAYARRDETAVVLGLTRAAVRMLGGEREAAIADLPRLLALADAVYAPDARQRLEARLSIAALHTVGERMAEAVALYEPTIAQWRALGLPETTVFATALSNLAQAVRATGDLPRAIVLARESVELRRRTHDGPHDDVASSLSNLAVMLAAQGDLAAARSAHDEALAMRTALFGTDSVRLLATLAGIADLERTRRDFDGALARLREAARICRIGENLAHPSCAAILHNLAYTHSMAGDFAEAERVAQETHALRERTLAPDDPSMARSHALLATIAVGAGRHEDALARADRALALMDGAAGIDVQTRLLTRVTRAQALAGLDRHDAAVPELDAVVAAWRQAIGPRHFRLVAFLAQRAKSELALGRADTARRTAREALALEADPALIRPETLAFLRETAGVPSAPNGE